MLGLRKLLRRNKRQRAKGKRAVLVVGGLGKQQANSLLEIMSNAYPGVKFLIRGREVYALYTLGPKVEQYRTGCEAALDAWANMPERRR